MPPREIIERIKKLRKEIEHHRYLYHVLDRQEISDAAQDSLKHELFLLEQKYPRLVTPDSPTQRVAGKPIKAFAKVLHSQRMLSFNDVFDEEELKSWVESRRKILADFDKQGFYAELKIDGLAIAMRYRKGLFELGSTRGDGLLGEDVTLNLKTIEAIPLRLRSRSETAEALRRFGWNNLVNLLPKRFPDFIEVRGEAFLTKKEFNRINAEQKRRGLPVYANPRNIAAGSIRQLNPKIVASRRLDFFAYDIVTDLGQKTHEETHILLRALGFKTNLNNKRINTFSEIISFRDGWEKKREKLFYEIDGIVVIVNDIKSFDKLGIVGKAPRGAVAFKFALREMETVIKDIRVQVGRTGNLTPVAVLRPVQIGGVTITHATLHNVDEIKRLDARVGDTVIVGRAGDVIPQVRRVLKGMRPKNARVFKMPVECPACGVKVKRESGGVLVKCPNSKCPARHRETLYHFVARPAFDIEGLGPQTIDKLVQAGLVYDPADFFLLSEKDFLELEGFAEISARKLKEEIASHKKPTLARFLVALGIPQVGEETAIDLSKKFHSLENINNASFEELKSVANIGDVVAKSIFEWFKNESNKKLLVKFKKAGVIPQKTKGFKKVVAEFSGKTFVFTGALENMTRDKAKDIVRSLGGKVSESVSKNTDFVVSGKDPGEKAKQAQKLRVRVIDEKQFLKMVK